MRLVTLSCAAGFCSSRTAHADPEGSDSQLLLRSFWWLQTSIVCRQGVGQDEGLAVTKLIVGHLHCTRPWGSVQDRKFSGVYAQGSGIH